MNAERTKLYRIIEKAGFVKVGIVSPARKRGSSHGAYTGRVSEESLAKSRYSAPAYYVLENQR